MRRHFRCTVVLTLAALLFATHSGHTQPAPQAPPKPKTTASTTAKKLTAVAWADSFASAITQAKATHKPIMVVFTATWCPACYFFKDTTCKNARVIAASDNFVNVLVNVDKQAALAKRYGATGTPSFIWLDSDGHVLNGMEGIGPVSEFLQEMQLALDQFNAVAASARV